MSRIIYVSLMLTVNQCSVEFNDYLKLKENLEAYIFDIPKLREKKELVETFIKNKKQNDFMLDFCLLIKNDINKINSLSVNEKEIILNISKRLSFLILPNNFDSSSTQEIDLLEDEIIKLFGELSFSHLKFAEIKLNLLALNDTFNQGQVYANKIYKKFTESQIKYVPELYNILYFKIHFDLKNRNEENILENIENLKNMSKKCNKKSVFLNLQIGEIELRGLAESNKIRESIQCFKKLEPDIKKGVDSKNCFFIYKIHSTMSKMAKKSGNIENAIQAQMIAVQILCDFNNVTNSSLNKKEFFDLQRLCLINGTPGASEKLAREKNISFSLNNEKATKEFDLAKMYFNERNVNKVLEHTSSSILLDDSISEAFEMRGKIYILTGNNDEAIGDFSKAIELTNNDPGLFFLRGICWWNKNIYTLAFKDFKKANLLSPKDTQYLFFCGLSCLELDLFEMALGYFNSAILHDKENASFQIAKAKSLIELQKYEQALDIFKGILNKDSKNYDCFFGKHQIFYRQGKFEESISELEKCIEIDPRFPSAYMELSLILSSCKNKSIRNGSKALALALKAKELRPDKKDWRLLSALASAQAEVGNFEEAISNQRQVIALLKSKDYCNKKKLDEASTLLSKFNNKLNP
jgi:tetratricopeptide (TPR) repeat protein